MDARTAIAALHDFEVFAHSQARSGAGAGEVWAGSFLCKKSPDARCTDAHPVYASAC
jgi:hypothetical protein